MLKYFRGINDKDLDSAAFDLLKTKVNINLLKDRCVDGRSANAYAIVCDTTKSVLFCGANKIEAIKAFNQIVTRRTKQHVMTVECGATWAVTEHIVKSVSQTGNYNYIACLTGSNDKGEGKSMKISEIVKKGPLSYQHHFMIDEACDHVLSVPKALTTLAKKSPDAKVFVTPPQY